MAYFYDIDDEEEKKKRGLPQATSSSSKGYFQEIEEPVKQQLEVKENPVKEDIQPFNQQPVQQQQIQEPVQERKSKFKEMLDSLSNVVKTIQSEGIAKLSSLDTDTQKSIKKEGKLLAEPVELSDLEKRELEVKKKAGLEATSKKVTEKELLIRKRDNPIEYLVNRPYAKTDEGYLQGDVDRTPMEAMEYKLKASADFYNSLSKEDKVRILSPDFVDEENYFSVAISARDTISRIENDLVVLRKELVIATGKDQRQIEARIKELEGQIAGLEMIEKGAYNEHGAIDAVKDFFSTKESIPVIGGGFSAEEAIVLLGAYKRQQEGEELTEREKMLIERNERGDTIEYLTNNYDIGYEITSGLLGSLSMMAEFVLAGALFKAVGLGAEGISIGANATSKLARGAGAVATGVLKTGVKAGQVTLTSGVGRVVTEATERQTPVYQYYWQTGESVKTKEGEDPAEAWTKAVALEYGNNVIEVMFDGMGSADDIAKNLLRQGAIQGFPQEFSEEILQKFWEEAVIEQKQVVLPKDYIDPETQFTFTPRELVTIGAVTLALGTISSALDRGEITQVEADIMTEQLQPKVQEVYDKASGRTQEELKKQLEQEQKDNPVDGTDYEGVIEEVGTEETIREIQTQPEVEITEEVQTPAETEVKQDGLNWEYGAEDMAAVPNEPVAFLLEYKGQDLANAKATISFDVDNETQADLGYKITLQDGTIVSNPQASEIGGSPYFETRQEAEVYAEKIISEQIETVKQQPKAKETPVKLEQEAKKYKTVEEFKNAIGETDTDLEDVVQFHGTQNGKELREAIKNGTIRAENGRYGKGFYLTTSVNTANYFGSQIQAPDGRGRIMTSNKPDIFAFDLSGLNIKRITRDDAKYTFDQAELDSLVKEGYDGVNFVNIGETVIANVEKLKELDLDNVYAKATVKKSKPPKTQKEQVKEVLAEGEAKSIKEIAQETKIKEPNIRRILGVGAKTGEFTRVGEGVYVLKTESGQVAYIETGNALESLPRLAKEGFKADMVFLDIPYDTPAVRGGNRGMKYNFITPEEFGEVLDSVNTILASENSPVIYMFSQAKSGWAKMQKYNEMLDEKGLKVIAKGEWQKRFQNGEKVTNVRGEVAQPEGILLLSQSGEIYKDIVPIDLNFDFVRPKGYQSEKNADMIKEMIQLTTNTGDVVLDPFAGSGVVPAEAIKAGRSAVAIEVDKKVVEETIKPRVEKASKEGGEDISKLTKNELYSETIRLLTNENIKEVRGNSVITENDWVYSFARSKIPMGQIVEKIAELGDKKLLQTAVEEISKKPETYKDWVVSYRNKYKLALIYEELRTRGITDPPAKIEMSVLNKTLDNVLNELEKASKEVKKVSMEDVRKEAKEYPRASNFAYIANRKYGMSTQQATEIWNEVNKEKEIKVEGLVGENQKRFTYKEYEFITTEVIPRSTPSPVPLDTSKKVLMLYGQTEDGWTFVENKTGLEPFTDKQLDEFIGKYKDRLIKQAPKEQKAGDDKMSMLESKAQSEYEKSWDKLTPQQQYKVLMGMEDGQRYIKTTDQDTLTKLGKGVGIMSSKDFTERNIDVLLYKGLEEKMYADGMILVTDSKVANELNKKFIEQYVKASAKTWKVSEQELNKRIKEGVKDKEFPATKDILDSAKANFKLKPIGFYTDGSIRQTGSIIFRAENGTLVRLSGKYYSAIKSFYPSAEFYITDESNVKPISFVVGKTRKGIVMPMIMPSDSTFTNLVGKKAVEESKRAMMDVAEREQQDRLLEKSKAFTREDMMDGMINTIASYIKEDIPIEKMASTEDTIGYEGEGTWEYDNKTGIITVSMFDGRTVKIPMKEARDYVQAYLDKKNNTKTDDDDIAFYTTARRRGQRGYGDITSMADIRRNLDILRKDRLRKGDVNIQENSKLVSNLLKYIGGNVKLSKQDIDTLYSQAIGVDELQYDPNGYTTLYRIGEVEVGKQTAFSATKTDSENDIAYKVHRDDIVIYLNSQEFKDSLKNVDISLVEGSNSIENLQEVFETYGRVEDEVIATPREVREGGDDQLMLTDSTVATVGEEDTLLQEARKYDSAEEFIKAIDNQGNTKYWTPTVGLKTKTGEPVLLRAYHGTTKQFDNFIIPEGGVRYTGDGVYFFPAKTAAENYISGQKNGRVIESYLDLKNPYNLNLPHGNIDYQPSNIELEEIKSKKHDSIIVRTGVGTQDDIINEIVVFNTDSIMTKEQLIDIWNKAQSETLKAKEDESKGSQSLETYEARDVTQAEQLKMSDEVKALVHKYADKVGEKYLPRGVLGVFYGKTKEIRLKGITDLYVASHEISHAIDKKYDITARITPRDSVDMQLREAYINLYPTAKETHAVKTQKLEGFAMAVATYLQRPSSFTQEYPVIVKEMFTQGGKYYNTEIGEYLNDVSNIVSRYQSLNDLDRVATRISKSIPTVEQTLFKSKTEATVNMLQNDLNLFERWVKENGDTMTKADFTNLFRFRTQVKQIYENNIATNLSKKNVEEGKFKNFMGGLYSYIRKSVAQDTYYAYNPETKNIERKHDFNWGTLRREVAQKGMDRQFNSLLVARRAYYDFEYADKLKAEIETIKADLEKQQDELIEMYQKKEGDRNKRDEKAKEVEIAGTKVILQEVESNLADVESLLRNDGWDRRLVTDSYLNNQGLFEKELDMFDKLVAEDILLAKNVGIISQEKYNELKDNKGYAPFKRIIYDEVLGEVDPSEISGNLKLGSKEISSLKKRTGSTKEIIYPLQSAMRNHMEFLNKSVSQDAINTFLTDRTMEMHSANIKKVEWHKGIENQKDIIIKMEDGVRKAYAVDPMIKELLSGYLSPKQVDWLEKVQQGYKQLFTMGTTGTYFPFVFTNLPRDAFNYITQTYQSSSIKAVYNLFADTAKVVLGKNPDNNLELQYFQKYLALGGREMTFVKYMEGDYDAFTTFLRQEEKGLKKIKNTIGKVAKVGLDVLSMPSQLSEMWYRSVEFIEAKKSGDSDVVALEKARRVTTPFHYRGSFKYKDSKGNITKAPNIPKYAPFQNAALQAFAWSGGNFIKDPKIRSRMLLMVGLTTAIGLEEMLRAWKNADDDDKEQFKDLTAEDLSRFIHIPKKGGGIRRIAVAEWAGSIAGTINMAVMDFILEDDVDYGVTDYTTALTTSLPDQFNLLPAVVKLIEKGTWDEFGKWGTSLLPALANPIIAIMGYKTYPEFAPLESSWQKTKLPADRYNEGTSKFAKWAMSLELPFDKGRLGDLMNLSPIQLDAILTQSFGRTIGMITGKPDAWNVLKSVNREYYFEYGRRLNDYWDTKEKNDQLYNSMTKGTREYSKEKELEVFRRKAISKDIDTALDEYKQAYDDKDIERIEKTRARVIDLVTRYNDNPSTPEMEIYLSNPNATTMEEAMRTRALREISMKDPRDYTKEELDDAKALAKEFRQEALLARSDYSYSELLFGITKNDDKVVKIEEVIEGKSEAEIKKYLASLKYAGMISNDVIIKLYNAGVINYELGKWANDLESNRNF